MAYSETQLQTWSHQGSTAQSAATYNVIRQALEDNNAPFADRSFEIFLQGSYGNDTNIYADSDVDVVICLTSVYYSDTSNLDASQKSLYDQFFYPATYSWRQFRNEVFDWLKAKFGSSVVDGKKAIFVCGDGNRRDADVLVCAEHRRYTSYTAAYSTNYHKGIVFWSSAGTEIVNFPKQHHDNCVTKHQNSMFRFKPNVRVVKNYRTALVNNAKLKDGVAPSYFLEGLLWNMPNANFGSSFSSTMDNFLAWLGAVDAKQLSCANDLHWLVRDGSSICWPSADFQSYVSAVRSDW